MTRLASVSQDQNNLMENSAKAQLVNITRNFIKFNEKKQTACVLVSKDQNTTVATSLFVLAINNLRDKDPKSREISNAMTRWLVEKIDSKTGQFQDDERNTEQPLAAAIATTAILSNTSLSVNPQLVTAAMDHILITAQKDNKRTPSILEMAWQIRAIVMANGGQKGEYYYFLKGICNQIAEKQVKLGAYIDSIGGFRSADSNIYTVDSAMATASLALALSTGQISGTSRSNILNAVKNGIGFIQWATYLSPEAYFSSSPSQWTGAVRLNPQFSTISLNACAAALEGLIAFQLLDSKATTSPPAPSTTSNPTP